MRLLTLMIVLLFLKSSLGKNMLPLLLDIILHGPEKAAERLPKPLFKENIQCMYHVISHKKETVSVELVELSSKTINRFELRKKRLTVFIVHGYNDGLNSLSIKNISKAFVKMCDNCNIFKVKYVLGKEDEIPKKIFYKGRALAQGLNSIIKIGLMKPPYVFVGIGLGAHLAGIASQHLKTKPVHVVGLNPAGTGFLNVSEFQRISNHSGKLVEVIHTDVIHGMSNLTIGHLDFYPNGGFKQPGCNESKDEFCNHLISAEYYAEAVTKPKSFLGVTCRGWKKFMKDGCSRNLVPMGTIYPDEANLTHGIYYLRTGWKSPYGLGENGTRPPPKVKKGEQQGEQAAKDHSFFKSIWTFLENFFHF